MRSSPPIHVVGERVDPVVHLLGEHLRLDAARGDAAERREQRLGPDAQLPSTAPTSSLTRLWPDT